jgi:hypothetical protein
MDGMEKRKNVALIGNRIKAFQPTASRYID